MYITVAAAAARQDEPTAPGGAAMDIAGAAEESENGLPQGHGGKKKKLFDYFNFSRLAVI
jgi:hypothetical protein